VTARPRQSRGVVNTRSRAPAIAVAVASAIVACSTSQPLACPVSASSACPSLDGVTAFCTWAEWGCAPEPACGGYFVLVDQAVDAKLTYYYSAASGQFAATVQEAFGGGNATCLAGPSQFQPPSGCEPDTLADCAPPPRDGGVTFGASDAAADGPFSAPSPSGSPSAQPFGAPPLATMMRR